MDEKIYDILNRITDEQYTKNELLSADYEKEEILDSLQIVQLVVELESEFNIEIEDEDLSIDNLKSFDRIVSLITRLA